MTDPRAYLADVLAKADAVDEFQGAWEWRESTPGEYNLPGCGRCGASDQVFESFVGEFIASARTTSPAMARALIAVVNMLDKRGANTTGDEHIPASRIYAAIAAELSTSFGWLDTDDADRASRWLRNRAATIAERTNDEPVGR